MKQGRPARGWLFRVCWLLVGAAIISVLFSVPVRVSSDADFWERFMDAAHLPIFTAVTLGLCWAFHPPSWPLWSRATASAVLAAGAAALVEALQPSFGRSSSSIDLRNGLFGVAVALCLLWGYRKRRSISGKLYPAALSLALFWIAFAPAVKEGHAILLRWWLFPVLADFESEVELRLWQTSGRGEDPGSSAGMRRDAEHVTKGHHGLRVETWLWQWPGVRLSTGGNDWNGYRTFAFDAFNPGTPFKVAVRIDDDSSVAGMAERYNGTVQIESGWNAIRIPIEDIRRGPRVRFLRLHAIRRVVLFLDAPRQERTFHLDHMRLEH